MSSTRDFDESRSHSNRWDILSKKLFVRICNVAGVQIERCDPIWATRCGTRSDRCPSRPATSPSTERAAALSTSTHHSSHTLVLQVIRSQTRLIMNAEGVFECEDGGGRNAKPWSPWSSKSGTQEGRRTARAAAALASLGGLGLAALTGPVSTGDNTPRGLTGPELLSLPGLGVKRTCW